MIKQSNFLLLLPINKSMKKIEKGFTLVELIIALIISTMILFAVGGIIVSTFSFWQKGEEQINLQKDISYAALVMEKNIREGISFGPPPPSGTQLNINQASGIIRFWLDNNNLMADLGAGGYILVNNVQDLSFTVSSASSPAVNITLTLNKDNKSSYLESTVMPRNRF